MPEGRKIILVGGGHAHVEVVRQCRLKQPHTRVTLISPHRHANYSGMLPGLIAGHYKWDECHIDLAALCDGGLVRFIEASACRIDTDKRIVECQDGNEYEYDLLSVDVGSTSDIEFIAGASIVGCKVKPVAEFLSAVEQILEQGTRRRLVIVGGGAAGMELCLALAHRARNCGVQFEMHLVTSAQRLAENLGPLARCLLGRALARQSVKCHLSKDVTQVGRDQLHFRDGGTLLFDELIWATGAAAPAWLRSSGLALDARGFIHVDASLRSTSHAQVYAAGDVASMASLRLAKSGVHAVRQGPILAHNLLFANGEQELKRYLPRSRSLALLSTGGHHAVASWGGLAWSGRWVWRWKDHIDRRFMRRYRDLQIK